MTRKTMMVWVVVTLAVAGCPDDEGDGTPPPAELVGRWQTVLTYVPAYYTGAIGVGVGNGDFIGSMGITFYFAPNGDYQFTLRTATTIGGVCFRTTVWSETGVVDIEGSSITFTSRHATSSILDSCGQAQYLDPAPTGSATYGLAITNEVLHLRTPTGEDIALQR